MLGDLVAVMLDHLARHRTGQVAVGEVVEEVVVGLLEADLERVAVERAQALDRHVVVHAVRLPRGRQDLVHPRDLALQQVEVGRLLLRVEVALHRVDVVLGHQLAALAVERGVVGEVDARLHAHRVERAALGDLRHGRQRVRDELHRPGEVVVLQRRLEDVGDEVAGIEVGELHGVEARLGDGEGVAQDLGRVGGGDARGRGGHRGKRRGER